MYTHQIKAGVAYLDEHYGRDNWLKRVNTGTLNMLHGGRCIIGQLEGEFDKVFDSSRTEEAIVLGFLVPPHNNRHVYHIVEQFSTLTIEWAATIDALRG